jgi:hypothetical protein
MKVVELVMVWIMGFVKDERTFLTLIFMKRIFQNILCEQLDFVVQMFAQPFFMVNKFQV